MIPEERVRRALLNIEIRQVVEDIIQLEAAILHLQTEGKENYDAAKKSNDRQEDYDDTSEEIFLRLHDRLQERKFHLAFLENELAILSDE